MKENDFDLLDLDATAGWRQLEVEAALDSVQSRGDKQTKKKINPIEKPKVEERAKKKKSNPVEKPKVEAKKAKTRTKPKKNEKRKKESFFRKLSAMDYVIAFTGVAIGAVAIVLGVMYSNIQTKNAQLEAFVSIGEELSGIGIAGEDTLRAMADFRRNSFKESETVSTEYEEKDIPDEKIEVGVIAQSVVKDLKVKFINSKTEKLIGGVPFKIDVVDAKNKSSEYADDDKDGVIYIKSIVSGEASIRLKPLDGYSDYSLDSGVTKVKIKENIDFKKIDVSNEVKTEAQVNAAKEDTARKESGGEILTDTVGWVESSKTLIEGEVSYQSLSKDSIADPFLSSKVSGLTYSQLYFLTSSLETEKLEKGEPVDTEEPVTEKQTSEQETQESTEQSTEEAPDTTKKEKATDVSALLKDKSGNQVYICVDGEYTEAKNEDYAKYDKFFLKTSTEQYKYTGWQDIDGCTYYFDAEGNKVTGDQIIQGARYSFGSDGALKKGSGTLGIDVSKWNGSIDWNKVKNAGVSYVIIRCGYRGSTTGALIEDPTFRKNISGATAAGLKVGVYFFSQATNEVEAVEEASMTLGLISGNNISFPVFLDVEPSGGRGDAIDSSTRTQVINAFCQTIKNSGYQAGVYANKNWLGEKFNPGSLSGCRIWLAQYTSAPSYSGRYDMWQYSSKGTVAGISGKVDMNLSYF